MMRRVVRIESSGERAGPRQALLSSFYAQLQQWYLQHDVLLIALPNRGDIPEALQKINPELVLTWGGRTLPNAIEQGPWRLLRHEFAWFPQSETIFFDPLAGTGGALEDLGPDDHLEGFHDWREAAIVQCWTRPSTGIVSDGITQPTPVPPYVLVLGSTERDNDPSIQWADIKYARELVPRVLEATNLPVVFRPKPGTHPSLEPHARLRVIRGTPLFPTLERATAAIGTTTAALVEAALVGRPSLALGQGAWPSASLAVWRTTPDSLQQDLERAIREWSPEKAAPWLNALRNVQIPLANPMFDHPRNASLLLGSSA